MDAELTGLIIERRHRVPLPASVPGDGAVVARQLDAVLISAGFKCSRDLFGWLSRADPGQVMDLGGQVIAAAWRMAGDHARHNPYFRDFPFNVPATLEFWAELLERALAGPQAAAVEGVFVETEAGTAVLALNLLSLPGYGAVQHTYEDMLAAHDALAGAAGDRITVLHAGGSLREETEALYLDLAGSTVPLTEEDCVLLAELARECITGPQPDLIPVRENRAILNAAALQQGRLLLADTVTDVLRLAAHVSGGNVSLEAPARSGRCPAPSAGSSWRRSRRSSARRPPSSAMSPATGTVEAARRTDPSARVRRVPACPAGVRSRPWRGARSLVRGNDRAVVPRWRARGETTWGYPAFSGVSQRPARRGTPRLCRLTLLADTRGRGRFQPVFPAADVITPGQFAAARDGLTRSAHGADAADHLAARSCAGQHLRGPVV